MGSFASVAEAQEARRESGAMVQELVVTAQRREQSLQDVPVSVSAVTGETLERQRISEFSELQKVAPGLSFNGANTPRGAGIAIRGVGTVSFSEGIEGSVGIVLDGVPIGRQGAGFTDLADLERIEVLRGPQGTLFGKNASAGVINIVTRRPSREFEAYGTLSYGEHDDTKIRANVSGPLALEGRVRGLLSGYLTKADGYLEDLNQDRVYNGREEWGARAKLEFEITEAANLLLTVDYSDRDVPCCLWTTRAFPANSTSIIRTLQLQRGIVAGPDNRQLILSGDVYQRQHTRGIAAELNIDLPGGHTLTSITSHRTWHEVDNNDADQTPLNILDLNVGNINQRQYTEEVRLASPSSGRFEYVLGLFYFIQGTRNDTIQRGTLGAPLPPGAAFGRNTLLKVDTENYAAFGDLTWRATDTLRLFGGARVTHEKVDYFFRRQVASASLPFPGNGPALFEDERSDTALSWRAGVQYDLQPNVMLYATVARGYKGGGFNVLISNTTPPESIAPEVPTSYEAGLKSELFDRRLVLNAAVYLTEFKDFQAQTLTTSSTGTLTFDLKNAGKLETRGLEIDFNAVPVEGLSLWGGVTYIDAKFESFINAACYAGQATIGTGCQQVAPGVFVQDLSGRRLPNAPKWNYTLNGRFERPIGPDYSAFAQAGYAWRSRTLTAQNQDPRSLQKSYGLLDASLGVVHDGGWTLSVWGKNVLDETFAEAIFDTPLDAGSPTAQGSVSQFIGFGARRTIGVALDVRF